MLWGNYILSNRSEWAVDFLSSVQFNFTIGGLYILSDILKLNCFEVIITSTFCKKIIIHDMTNINLLSYQYKDKVPFFFTNLSVMLKTRSPINNHKTALTNEPLK